MTADFDLDVVIFRCMHGQCGEIFEKSLDDLGCIEEVFCPRCGTAATIGKETLFLAAARNAAGPSLDETAE